MPISYQIWYRDHTVGGSYSLWATVTDPTTVAIVTGLLPAHPYDFYIIADDGVMQTNSSVLPITTLTGESPEGTAIHVDASGNSTSSIIDANNATWTIVGGVVFQGNVSEGGSGVVELYYHNHTVYQMNSSQYYWWSWSGTAWTGTVADPRGNTVSAATQITPGSGSFVDTTGVTWSIAASGNAINVDDLTNTGLTNVTLGYFSGSVIYFRTGASTWYLWQRSFPWGWTTTTNPLPNFTNITVSPVTFVASSTSGTQIGTITVNVSNGSYTAGVAGLQLGGADASFFQIATVNGVMTLETLGTTTARSYTISIQATEADISNSPFTQTGIGITGTASATIGSVALSKTSFTSGVSNAVVGTINVTMSSGTFAGTYGIGGTNGNLFQLVNTNQVATIGSMTGGPWSINVYATQTSTGQQVNSQTYSITATASAWPNNPPPQAVSAGYTTLKFFDDFTTTTTIAPNRTPTSGYKWYPFWVDQAAGTNYNVLTTTFGSGPNASPNGGVLQMLGNTLTGNDMILEGTPYFLQNSTENAWKHCYFEGCLQYATNGTAQGAGGWPSFWTNGVVGGSNTEIDFMEFNPVWGQSANWTIWDPAGSTRRGSGTMISPADAGWHIYGCLWTSTGTGTGNLAFYCDNVFKGSITTGTGGAVPNLENNIAQFMILGTGWQYPCNYDWIKVWTAS